MKKFILTAVALGALGTGGAFAQVLCGTANTPQCPNPATAPYYYPGYYPHPSSSGIPPQSWGEAATAARVWSGRDQYAYGSSPWLGWNEPRNHRDRDGDGIRNNRDRDRDGDGIRNRRDRYPDDPRFR